MSIPINDGGPAFPSAAMSPEKQRSALAVANGFRRHPNNGWIRPDHPEDAESNNGFCSIPNYPTDLNACHEAVNTLIVTEEQCEAYATHLRKICCVSETIMALMLGYWQLGKLLLNATAPQCCEAIVRTLGICEEEGEKP